MINIHFMKVTKNTRDFSHEMKRLTNYKCKIQMYSKADTVSNG